MAQLVAVCRGDNYKFQRRQMPLVVDDTLTVCKFVKVAELAGVAT